MIRCHQQRNSPVGSCIGEYSWSVTYSYTQACRCFDVNVVEADCHIRDHLYAWSTGCAGLEKSGIDVVCEQAVNIVMTRAALQQLFIGPDISLLHIGFDIADGLQGRIGGIRYFLSHKNLWTICHFSLLPEC